MTFELTVLLFIIVPLAVGLVLGLGFPRLLASILKA